MALFAKKDKSLVASIPEEARNTPAIPGGADTINLTAENFVQSVEDDAAESQVVSGGDSPTLDELLAMPPDATFQKVRVPLVTRAARVAYEKWIKLNNRKFLPGKTYLLHPRVAAELRAAIDRYEQVPVDQMTGKTNMTPELAQELALQAAERGARF